MTLLQTALALLTAVKNGEEPAWPALPPGDEGALMGWDDDGAVVSWMLRPGVSGWS